MVMMLLFDTSNNNNESNQGTKRTLALMLPFVKKVGIIKCFPSSKKDLDVKSKQDSTKDMNSP